LSGLTLDREYFLQIITAGFREAKPRGTAPPCVGPG